MWTYLWQNFLIDAKIRSYIADKVSQLYHTTWGEALIEIGPGKGSITKLISTISPNFLVIEKDPTFFENWKLDIEPWKFILGDVLEIDVQKLLEEKHIQPSQTLIVGNLPYYITSPILRKFFGYGQKDFAWWIVMVQDEVGQKLKSDANKKSYLRRLLNYAYEVTYLKWVPAKCFKPAPKVKSCLIELKIKNWESGIEFNTLVEFLELFAPFSRKTLGAIETMINKRFAINASVSRDENREASWKAIRAFHIPDALKKKRLEELDRKNLEAILVK